MTCKFYRRPGALIERFSENNILSQRTRSWWLGIDWRPESEQYMQRNTGKRFPREYFQRYFLSAVRYNLDWVHDTLKDRVIITILSTGEFNYFKRKMLSTDFKIHVAISKTITHVRGNRML